MRIILTCLMVLFAALCPPASDAGYKDLVDEFDAYTPPDYIVSQKSSAAAVSEPTPSQSPSDEHELKRIQIMSADWRKSISAADRKMPLFFTPKPTLLDKYQEAALDSTVAFNAIRGQLSLTTLETLAWLRNPDIKSAENRFAASVESFSQVANLDEILRQYSAFTASIKTGVGPMKGQDPVTSKFPFPGMVSLKGQIVQQETQGAWHSLEAVRRDVITTVRKTYWDLVFNRKAQQITADTVRLFEKLEAVAARRYEAGKTSFQDVVKIQVKTKVLKEESITLKERQRIIESKIIALLNIPPTTPIGYPSTVGTIKKVPLIETLYPMAQDHRHEILIKQAQLKKMQIVLEMAETMVLPSYTLNYSTFNNQAINTVGSSATTPSFKTSSSASRGAGLPQNVWFGTNDAYVREIRQLVAALKESLAATKAETINKVSDRWFALDRARREKKLYQDTVVSLSKSALDVSTSGYESGNVSFADVINSYELWLSSNLNLEKKRSEFFTSWAQLERVVGVQF
ncbi:MAG: TolC family protein [Desulfosarcina sp.]